jgi:Protein of unknown function (DUF1203)
MSNTAFAISGIDPAVADQLRSLGGISYVADSKPGYPCRQCLRDAEIGEEVLLVSFDPFTASSPYRCASPIFIHSTSCTPNPEVDVPEQLARGDRSVRAFDKTAMMLDAALIQGEDLGRTIERLLENPEVDHLHIHNEPRGCWAARVARC